MNSKFQALAVLFVELLAPIILLGNLCKHLEVLLHHILLDRIHDAFHQIQPLWDKLVTIIHDENATHTQLDVVAFLLCLKQIEGSTKGHKQQRTQLS